MVSITKLEDDLFARWRLNLPLIIQDGIFHEACYKSATPKILFVLKEPHSKDPDAAFDLRDVVGDGKYAATWTNIARWAKALRLTSEKGTQNVSYQDLEETSPEIRRDELKFISVMNLKKRVGESSTNMNKLKAYIDRKDSYANFLTQQFDLYDPDLVICCGSEVAETLRNILNIPNEWSATKRGIWYYLSNSSNITKKDTPIISWVHPQLRGSMRWPLATFPLIDAWTELSDLRKE